MKTRLLSQVASSRGFTRASSLSPNHHPRSETRTVHCIAPQAASIPSTPRQQEHLTTTLDATSAARAVIPPPRSSIRRVPPGAWDSHMHIIDPSTFSLSAQAVYRLERHYSLDDALSFESSIGIRNIVLVQPSIYGHDNACLLDALRRLAGLGSARGVVSFDPADTPPLATLRRWHALGVRGVRVNVQSHGVCIDPGKLASDLRRYADAIRPLGKWVLQLYVPMSLMQGLEDIIPRLGVRVCIDHLGYPDLTATRRSPLDLHCLLPGFQSLLALLQSGETFVKLSAPYRIVNSFDEDSYLEAITKELLQVRGASRVVFGTDWPHTRFEGLDIRPWIERVLDWCDGNENTVERVFKRNAEELWDVPQAKSMHS